MSFEGTEHPKYQSIIIKNGLFNKILPQYMANLNYFYA